MSVRIRLYAVINYGECSTAKSARGAPPLTNPPAHAAGRVIHEFDPWFNYRATEYMAANGWDKFQVQRGSAHKRASTSRRLRAPRTAHDDSTVSFVVALPTALTTTPSGPPPID